MKASASAVDFVVGGRVNDGGFGVTKAGAGMVALAPSTANVITTSRLVAVLLGQGATFLPMLRVAYPLGAKAAALVASDFDDRLDLAGLSSGSGEVSVVLRA